MVRLLGILGIVILAACGDSTAPAPPTMTGTWRAIFSGELEGAFMTLTLVENDATISGSGTLQAGTTGLALSVTGSHAHPSVSMTMKATGYEDMNFTGTLTGDDQVIGTLVGSGFNGYAATLNRQ